MHRIIERRRIVSTLHANYSYQKAEIVECDHKKTTFTSQRGLYQFVTIPFKLDNAPDTFQPEMDVILFPVKCQSELVNLEDIVVLWKAVKHYLNHLQHVLMVLQDTGVILKLMKCSIFSRTINYLGHINLPEELKIAESTTDATR